MKFENTVKLLTDEELKEQNPFTKDLRPFYRFDKPPALLYLWSRLFQQVVSETATKMLTGKWNSGHFGIFKSEGGCSIPGVGDLVLYKDSCRFDYGVRQETAMKQIEKCANLITHIVVNWDPEDAVDSMMRAACEFINVDEVRELRDIIGESQRNPFEGDALSSFFDYNPFGKFPIDRKYQKYCLIKHNKMSKAEVKQKFADEDLGEKLLKQLIKAVREHSAEPYPSIPLCCSPSRDHSDGSLKFWINDGRRGGINGWKSEKEIKEFIKKPVMSVPV